MSINLLQNVFYVDKTSIMYGVTIDKKVVTGANKVFTKGVLVNSVVGGIPIKVLKNYQV
jgi:acetyltransferase-like isoleucine patch superfamily enzyme